MTINRNSSQYYDKYMELVETNLGNDLNDETLQQHHIIPESLGGANARSNLVALSPKDHVLAHELLFKHYMFCVEKMAHAYSSMLPTGSAEAKDIPQTFNYDINGAYAVTRKRIVYRLSDLKPMKLNWNEQTPSDCVERPKSKRYVRVYNIENLSTGTWPKDTDIPAGWATLASAPPAVKDIVFPSWRKAGEISRFVKYVGAFNPKTSENRMFKNVIPRGWIPGVYPEKKIVLKQRLGADKSALTQKNLDTFTKACIREDIETVTGMLSSNDFSAFDADPWKYGIQTYKGLTMQSSAWARLLGIKPRRMKDLRSRGMRFQDIVDKYGEPDLSEFN